MVDNTTAEEVIPVGPMRYEYWTINQSDILAVALFGYRIMGVGQEGYYAEMPADPKDAGDWDFSETARLGLEANRAAYDVYHHPGFPRKQWRPRVYVAPALSTIREEMEAYRTGHETLWGGRAHQLNVDVDYGDLCDWINCLETQERVTGGMPMEELVNVMRFLTWAQSEGYQLIRPDGKNAFEGQNYMPLIAQWVEHENIRREEEKDGGGDIANPDGAERT
jgi:hypothetical protein